MNPVTLKRLLTAIAAGCLIATAGILYSVAQQIQMSSNSNAYSNTSCTNCAMTNSTFTSPMTLDGMTVKPLQVTRATTATDGSYTWTYPVAFASAPYCQATAQATSGSTDVINAQIDGAPTTTQAKVKVNRNQQSVVALIGLTILSVPASIGAQTVTISCWAP